MIGGHVRIPRWLLLVKLVILAFLFFGYQYPQASLGYREPGQGPFAGFMPIGGGFTNGCCGDRSSGVALEDLEGSALVFYRKETGDTDPVDVEIRDFGCHVEAFIYKDGNEVANYGNWNGQWQQIDPVGG